MHRRRHPKRKHPRLRHHPHSGRRSRYGRDKAGMKRKRSPLQRAHSEFIAKHTRGGKMSLKAANKLWIKKKNGKGHKKGHARKGHRSLESFGSLESYLDNLIGGRVHVHAMRRRPSESLAAQQARIQKLSDKFGAAIAVLRRREEQEDLSAKEEKEFRDAIKKLERERAVMQAARRAPYKGPGTSSYSQAEYETDPGGRAKKRSSKKKPKKKGKKRASNKPYHVFRRLLKKQHPGGVTKAKRRSLYKAFKKKRGLRDPS